MDLGFRMLILIPALCQEQVLPSLGPARHCELVISQLDSEKQEQRSPDQPMSTCSGQPRAAVQELQQLTTGCSQHSLLTNVPVAHQKLN